MSNADGSRWLIFPIITLSVHGAEGTLLHGHSGVKRPTVQTWPQG